MRLHRFYISPDIELKQDFWLHDEPIVHQWRHVLRVSPGQEVVLFDGRNHDRLYKITEINEREAHLQHITDFKPKVPAKEVFLLWAMLKKDKNEWILQKCTELGVSHFVPLLADRSEKTGFNMERAKKIVIEAAEQCGRSDIPAVREPMTVETAVKDYKELAHLLVCEKSDEPDSHFPLSSLQSQKAVGVLVGPEGGWSDAEKELFKSGGVQHLNLHDFTLRAETACVVVASKLLQ